MQVVADIHAVRVELDLLDGTVLRTEPVSQDRARQIKAELERRIFEIGEGIRMGPRDRM